MINADMILNSTESSQQKIKIKHYPGFEYYRDYAARISEYFTGTNIIDDIYWGGSDSDAFYFSGYPAVYFEEAERSKYYHTINDLFENYSGTEYCAEVTKAILANLIVAAEVQDRPKAPYRLVAIPEQQKIVLNWERNNQRNILGYNIYRKDEFENSFAKLNSSPIVDTFFIDMSVKNTAYYYTVSAVDSLLNESVYNFLVKSRAVTLDQGILVVDQTSDGSGAILNPNDEQVDSYFSNILENYNKKDFDIAKEGNITLADMGAFSTLVWHVNAINTSNISLNMKNDIKKYLGYGGKIFFTGFYPSKILDSNLVYPHNYSTGNFLFDVFKISRVNWKYSSKFFGGLSDQEYPSIFVDTLKTKKTTGFHLSDIESIEAAPGAEEIYFYDSEYDTSTIQGSMKNSPVGVEYIGDDYKVFTLSFPLYYMNQEQSKELVQYILSNKFNEVTFSGEDKEVKNAKGKFYLAQNYPNPFNPSTIISYQLPVNSKVNLKIFNTLGQEVETFVNEFQIAGFHSLLYTPHSSLPSGVYFYQLTAGNFVCTKKIILIK
jgi:hypothetical protein